jgi:RNA polymerase sigma-70 factor (ECF subfamily)
LALQTDDFIFNIRQGDEQSFELFFKNNYQRLCSYAYTFLKDTDDAEDIVQQIFVNMWEKRQTLTIETSVMAYLMRAVRNAALNKLKHAEVKERYTDVQELNPSTENVTSTVFKNELQKQIFHAIETLPPQCKIIFELSRYEELTYNEIARQLNLSVKTVENQMGKALRIMREQLKDYLLWFIILGSGIF